MKLLLVAGLIVALGLAGSAAGQAPSPAASADPMLGACVPVNGLSFVCGLKNPEDLILVPKTRWMLTSGMAAGGGLRLVDVDAKIAKPLYTGNTPARADKATYPDCAGPPDPATFNTHGIALRPSGAAGEYRLFAVSHGAVEGVQVFSLDARGPEPTLAWVGCVALPEGKRANSVTAFSDGEILMTVSGGIGAPGASMFAGAITGAVFSWKPGARAFRQVVGTEMSGPNGIEASPDEKEFYVASSGSQTVSVFSRANPARPLRQARSGFFNIDNLRWTDGHLLAAGMMFDEPACGGTRQQISERGGNPSGCIRGFVASELNPQTMQWRVVGYGEPNPVFGGIATAVIVGKTLWISSYNTDRVAYRALPGN